MALVGLGLAGGLAAAEALVRLAGLAPEVVLVREGRFQLSANPELGYEPVPGVDYDGKLDGFHDFVGRSNSLGFRDRERTVAKEPGVFRILVLGDSVAAGQGVRDPETIFPARLEAGLRQAGLAAEVLNFAVTGYDTRQEVALLADRGLAFAPDLVLLAYCLNDVRQDDGGILAGLRASNPQGASLAADRINPYFAWSALYRMAWARRTAPEQASQDREDAVAAAFDALGGLGTEHAFRVLVVVFPRFGGLLGEYRFSDQHRLPETAARRNGFAYFELLPAFRACRLTAESRLARDRYHPTAAGHACAAEAVRDFIVGRREALGLTRS